jgi:hypothetical protein
MCIGLGISALRAAMALTNHVKHILKINNTPRTSETMTTKMCTAIRTLQTTINKVIRVPIKPAMIVELRWTWFPSSVENEEVCLMRQPECLEYLIQMWLGTRWCLPKIL